MNNSVIIGRCYRTATTERTGEDMADEQDFGYVADFEKEVGDRLRAISDLASRGGLEKVVEILAGCIERGGVIHAFGTGHSEAFAMELAGRAGGLIPTNKIALRDTVLYGDHTIAELEGNPPLERDPDIAADLFATVNRHPEDVFVIASNSGVNGPTCRPRSSGRGSGSSPTSWRSGSSRCRPTC